MIIADIAKAEAAAATPAAIFMPKLFFFLLRINIYYSNKMKVKLERLSKNQL